MEYVVRVSGSQKITPKVININGSDDSFYRYKMRQLYVQVVGKGKMIKTTLLNVDDVSRDLKLILVTKLEPPPNLMPKKPERERGSISGEYDPSYLSSIVKKMIDEFILCGKCGLPECSVAVDQKTKKITMECRGCGGSSTPVLNDKFQKFILNNEVKLKEVKALEKKKPDQAATAAAAAAASTAAAPKPKKERAKGPEYDSSNFKDIDDDDDDWAASTTEEAIRERQMKLLPEKLKALVVDPNAEKPKEPENGLSPKKNLDAHFSEFATNHSKQELLDEIKKVQKEQKFDNAQRVVFFFNNAFTKGQDTAAQFAEIKPLLKNLLVDEQSHFAAAQWFDAFCEDDASSSQFANILKTLYDEEFIEEEGLLKWHASAPSTPHGAAIRKHLDAFVEWLKNAEEESDDD